MAPLTLLFFKLFLTLVFAEQQCAATNYTAASKAHIDPTLQTFAGLTRSVVQPSLYSLITPESRVYGPPPPGWSGGKAAAVVTPALGAHFAMYLVEASAAELPSATKFKNAPDKLERLLYVLHGSVTVRNGSAVRELGAGGYVYYAPGEDKLSTEVVDGGFILIDRIYAGVGGAESYVGDECEVEVEICEGEVFKLRRLLDKDDERLDFNIHVMDFAAGEFLNVKEVHYNQHGLLMLTGMGVYMLGKEFYPVSVGDVIYMAPFVPQWFGALGKGVARYFLYKDTNVDPLVG